MTIMWTTERALHFSELTLDDAIAVQARMRIDLLGLASLTADFERNEVGVVVTEKGYAVDGYCNGSLSRVHYDSDILVAIDPGGKNEAIEFMMSSLQASTGKDWQPTQQQRGSWIKLHNPDIRQWDDGTTSSLRDRELSHQIDVHFVERIGEICADELVLRSSSGESYTKQLRRMSITDGFGGVHDLLIPSLEDMAATKTRLTESFKWLYNKGLRPSDLYDFTLMFAHPDFQAEQYLDLLRAYYSTRLAVPSVDRHIMQEIAKFKTTLPNQLIARLGELGVIAGDHSPRNRMTEGQQTSTLHRVSSSDYAPNCLLIR